MGADSELNRACFSSAGAADFTSADGLLSADTASARGVAGLLSVDAASANGIAGLLSADAASADSAPADGEGCLTSVDGVALSLDS